MNWIDLSGMRKPAELPAGWDFRSLNEHMSDKETATCGDTLLVTLCSHDIKDNELIAVRDHVNLSGKNPLRGHNNDEYGVRFPDMSHPYALPEAYDGEGIIIRAGQDETHPMNAIDATQIVYQTILAKHQLKTVYALIYGKSVSPDDILKIMTGE